MCGRTGDMATLTAAREGSNSQRSRVLSRGVGEKVFLLLYFVLWVREGYKGGGMIWKGWEMSGIGTHDMQSSSPPKQ